MHGTSRLGKQNAPAKPGNASEKFEAADMSARTDMVMAAFSTLGDIKTIIRMARGLGVDAQFDALLLRIRAEVDGEIRRLCLSHAEEIKEATRRAS